MPDWSFNDIIVTIPYQFDLPVDGFRCVVSPGVGGLVPDTVGEFNTIPLLAFKVHLLYFR